MKYEKATAKQIIYEDSDVILASNGNDSSCGNLGQAAETVENMINGISDATQGGFQCPFPHWE